MNSIEIILTTLAAYTGLLIPFIKWLHVRYKVREKDERIKYLENWIKEFLKK